MPFPPGIAAGHPATAEAGLEVLAEGGTAADAAVAAALASCVAETVMTGIAGGGFAVWLGAGERRAELLDFFVAVPGLGGPAATPELEELAVPFGEELVHYYVGAATCAVPGVPAGLEELWRRFGSLPWRRLVEPALRLARDGVPMPAAHAACLAMLAPVMTMREGARIYSPTGRLLASGELLEQPGLAAAFAVLADEGARSFYEGTMAEALLGLVEERGGVVTRADLAAYRVGWLPTVGTEYAGVRIETRGGLTPLGTTLAGLPPLRGATPGERVLALARLLAAPPYSGRPHEHTTNLCVVDAAGNACVVTTSLGLGSGDYLPGYDVHLNSMLGEADLLVAPLEPGARMESMMSPAVALDADGLVLATGAAGGTRLRPALVQVLSGILDEGLAARDAVDRPRLHSTGHVVHLEPGFDESAVDALLEQGYRVRLWQALHHYFGGVSVVGRAGAAGDPRRSGAALELA
ncbi:MAG TPA: gamma-glutamyltransferase [Gaiellaceae bacterium]|nr:gamma-glutamyltransferase [Gaiellaceae bacterium]